MIIIAALFFFIIKIFIDSFFIGFLLSELRLLISLGKAPIQHYELFSAAF
jgi:hypothetical protein